MKMNLTKIYDDGLQAGQARAFVQVLNPGNILHKDKTWVKKGKWSHDEVKLSYRPPLFVLCYTHSTHAGEWKLDVHFYDGEEHKNWLGKPISYQTVLALRPTTESLREEDLEGELAPFRDMIVEWVQKYLPALYNRSIQVGVLEGFLPEPQKCTLFVDCKNPPQLVVVPRDGDRLEYLCLPHFNEWRASEWRVVEILDEGPTCCSQCGERPAQLRLVQSPLYGTQEAFSCASCFWWYADHFEIRRIL